MKRIQTALSAILAVFMLLSTYAVAAAANREESAASGESAGKADRDIVFIPMSQGGTWGTREDDQGEYYAVPCVVNGEVQELYIRDKRNPPVTVPCVLTDVTIDENGFILSGTPIYEYNPDVYEVGIELTGYHLLDDGTFEMGWYNGPEPGGTGITNGSGIQNTESTILPYDENTRVYNFVEGVATLNEGGIESLTYSDFNDKCMYYAENGVLREVYIVNVNSTLRLSTAFAVNDGVIYTFTIESHGAFPGTVVPVTVTPLSDVKTDATFHLDCPLSDNGTDSVTFQAGTKAGESQTMEFTAPEYRMGDISIWLSDATDPDDVRTVVGYVNLAAVDSATGDVTPDMQCTVGEGSTVKWYAAEHDGNTNLITIVSAKEISSTEYENEEDLVLSGSIAKNYVGSIVCPVIYATSVDGPIDQNLGTTIYEVDARFDGGDTEAEAELTNNGVQYARLTLSDQGTNQNTPTTLTVAKITNAGTAVSVTSTGGSVDLESPVNPGTEITYSLNEADAVDGVITLNLTAYDKGFNSIVASPQSLVLNGNTAVCEKYNIDGYNYFKLRDLAALLNGTGSQFSVTFDESNLTAYVETGKGYVSVGGELEAARDNSSSCTRSDWKLVVDGQEVNVSAFDIAGNNYYKLRDLADIIGYNVDYLEAENCIAITSK